MLTGLGVDLGVNGNPGITVVINSENSSNNNSCGERTTIKAENAKI